MKSRNGDNKIHNDNKSNNKNYVQHIGSTEHCSNRWSVKKQFPGIELQLSGPSRRMLRVLIPPPDGPETTLQL